jgi:hypothetical protein
MTDEKSQWDDRLKSFLKRTGDELKRAGEEIKREGEKLMKEVSDPEKQKKVKDGLSNFGTWAKKTAQEVAEMVETGVKKAEGAFRAQTAAGSPPPPSESTGSNGSGNGVPAEPADVTPTDAEAAKKASDAAKKATKKPKKTIGKKR